MSIKIYTKKHEETADYVRCCVCGKEMLVSHESDNCPACKSFGTLVWANDEHVVNVSEFKDRLRKLRETA